MFKPVLAALIALLLALPALAQGVRVTRTDGTVIQGDLLGYENGRYQLRLPNGAVEEIEEAKIQDIVLVDLPPSAYTHPQPVVKGVNTGSGSPLTEEAREAIDRGDLDGALHAISKGIKELDLTREEFALLSAKISIALVERFLERRDTVRLAESLRRLLPTLNAEDRRALITRLTDRAAELQKTDPGTPYSTAFAEMLGGLADEGAVPAEGRASLADLFIKRGDSEAALKHYSTAFALLHAAARLDPSRKDDLKGRALQQAILNIQTFRDRGDLAGALKAARDAVALDPSNADAKTALGDAEFGILKYEIDADLGSPEAIATLKAFLEKSPRPEQRVWAERALARMSEASVTLSPEVADQLRKYYPIKVGRSYLYRRGSGEIREKVRIDSVVREGDVLKVYNTLKELYRDYSTTKAYVVEVEKDAVVMNSPAGREPLLKFPLRPNDSWTWQLRGREFRRTVTATAETVTVGQPDGPRTYNDCLVIDFTSTVDRDGAPVSITSRSTYAPGIGLVKLEFTDPEFRKFDLELVEITSE